jgi:hypothetical protein
MFTFTQALMGQKESECDKMERMRLSKLRDRMRPLVEAAVCEYLPSSDNDLNQNVVDAVNEFSRSPSECTLANELAEFYHEHACFKADEADSLLRNWKLGDIESSLRKKYSSVPQGWSITVGIHQEICRCIGHLVQGENNHQAFLVVRLLRTIVRQCGRFCTEELLSDRLLGDGPIMKLWRKHKDQVCRINMEIADELVALVVESRQQFQSDLHLFPALVGAYQEMAACANTPMVCDALSSCSGEGNKENACPQKGCTVTIERALMKHASGSDSASRCGGDVEMSVISYPQQQITEGEEAACSTTSGFVELDLDAFDDGYAVGFAELELESDFERDFDILAQNRSQWTTGSTSSCYV